MELPREAKEQFAYSILRQYRRKKLSAITYKLTKRSTASKYRKIYGDSFLYLSIESLKSDGFICVSDDGKKGYRLSKMGKEALKRGYVYERIGKWYDEAKIRKASFFIAVLALLISIINTIVAITLQAG